MHFLTASPPSVIGFVDKVLQSIQKAVSDGRAGKSTLPLRHPVSGRSKAVKRRPQTTKAVRPRLDGDAAGWDSGLVIFCDGACEPNPGAGGWGFVVYRDDTEIHSDCGGSEPATNQTMELTAAIMALRWFAERGISEPVRLLSDSQYVVKGCNDWRHGWKANGWKRGGPKAKPENAAIANLDLWKELDEALAAVPIQLEWVKGRAGILGNEWPANSRWKAENRSSRWKGSAPRT